MKVLSLGRKQKNRDLRLGTSADAAAWAVHHGINSDELQAKLYKKLRPNLTEGR